MIKQGKHMKTKSSYITPQTDIHHVTGQRLMDPLTISSTGDGGDYISGMGIGPGGEPL